MSSKTHSLEQCEQQEINNLNKKKIKISNNNNHSNSNDNEFSISNQPSLTFSLLSNSDNLNIATHNIITFRDNIKNDQIIEHALINNIHILEISETNIPSKQIPFIKKNLNPMYTYFFESNKDKSKGNGVGFLVHNSIKDHIFYSSGNKGRYLFIDIQLKNKKKIRIFQIYLHANNRDIRERVLLQSEIILKAEDAKKKGYELIIMGDFNVDIYKDQHNKSHRNEKVSFINKLKHLSLKDTTKLIHQSNQHKLFYTWRNPNKTINSILDYIFISASLLPTLLYSDIITPELYRSDHNMVIAMLFKKDLFSDNPIARARSCQHNKRKIFNYKKMNKEKWEAYGLATDVLCRYNTFLSRFKDSSIQSPTDLNR